MDKTLNWSIPIQKLVLNRDKALKLIEQAYKLLDEASALTYPFQMGTDSDWLWHIVGEQQERPSLNHVTQNMDSLGWRYLIEHAETNFVIDHDMHQAWHDNVHPKKNSCLRLNTHNIQNVSNLLLDMYRKKSKLDMVEFLFRKISWDTRHNVPIRLNQDIELPDIVKYHPQYGYSLNNTQQVDAINDIQNTFHKLEEKNEKKPHSPTSTTHSIRQQLHERPSLETWENHYLAISWSPAGNSLIRFKEKRLVDICNQLIAQRYPACHVNNRKSA